MHGDKGLMEMKVAELKEELSARGEAVSGNKAWLRRRLHAAIVRDYLEARDAEGFCALSISGRKSRLLTSLHILLTHSQLLTF